MNRLNRIHSPLSHKSYTLLTGATGLVGQYLLRDLITEGHRLAVIVRPARKHSASQRVEQIMHHWDQLMGHPLPRPVVLTGDVSQKGLGLCKHDRNWVFRNCSKLIHNAAVLQFAGPSHDHEPWQTNLQGTRHTLELARQSDIPELHYVSTAYVCGKRTGTVLESELDCGQDFRNDYERSKFAAEQLVHGSNHFASRTIYRPTVIAGDSRSGYTSTYHGIYVYLRLFALFIPRQQRDERGRLLTRIQIPLDGDEPRNLITVDWMSRVFCEVFANREAHGKTFHMAPDDRLTAKRLFDSCSDYFGSCGAEFCGVGNACDSIDAEFAKHMFENLSIYGDYATSDPRFDTTNVKRFAGHIPCPIIDSAMIHRFLDFGVKDNWGKRKPSRLVVPDYRPSHLTAIREAASKVNEPEGSLPSPNETFGIRITGIGGGDWSFSPNGNGYSLHRGMDRQTTKILQYSSDELERLAADVDTWRPLLRNLLSHTADACKKEATQEAKLS